MDVLYETDDLVAVNKAPGVPVAPAAGYSGCVRAQLESERGERLFVVHRLDAGTSGVLVFARNAGAHRRLSMAFEHREVAKTYLAWTNGVPDEREGTIDVPLHEARRGKMRPAKGGETALESVTRYRVLRTFRGIASVEARPLTGRHHQLRVHLRAIGVPLLVDPRYGRRKRIDAGALGPGSPEIVRLTLHASSLELPGERPIEAPLADDLAALDRWLSS